MDRGIGRPGPDLRHLLARRGDALAGRGIGAAHRSGAGEGTTAGLAGLYADGVTPTDDIEVGWHLHPDSWGHGYATEAARAVVEREFATGTNQVFAVVMAGNDASMAVARRLGMTHVGTRTDWYGGEELEAFVLCATG
ncbi:Acetyltransferase (GNAT) domain-containing protein [Micromonospora rhizosphaerae]|uniref:Acetyltransferase (GNAT) domain-containing protein n=1 Tax=Micromonospora rhizosphaerae TaxID=568872 RepID=A0A1C6RW54_9ACTN|nr:Acetyltransferase (GNAT) domain-containing protein [Micromonospora rhizosphaerae]